MTLFINYTRPYTHAEGGEARVLNRNRMRSDLSLKQRTEIAPSQSSLICFSLLTIIKTLVLPYLFLFPAPPSPFSFISLLLFLVLTTKTFGGQKVRESLDFSHTFLISSHIHNCTSLQHNHKHLPVITNLQLAMAMEITTATAMASPSSKLRPSLPSPSTSSPPHAISKSSPQLKLPRLSLPTISLLALFAPHNEARAAVNISKDQIVSSLTQVEQTIDQVQVVGSGFLDTAQRVAEAVGNVLKPGFETALPIVQQAGGEAFKFASPAFSEASKKAQEALQSSGVDSQSVLKTVTDAAQQTTKVLEGAKPIASSTVETISSSDPTVIAGTAGALFVAYLLFPPIWSVISFNFRGYKGDLTPAQTLDMLCTQNYILIDIRSEKDKDKAGIPRLPSSAKNKMVAIPLEELPSKLRGLVRNVKRVEAEIAALKISYLKKINKGTNIVILDTYSDSAKVVARTLTGLGFKNSWIVADGFSGGKGWLQSRLGTDSYNFSFAEILSPSRIIPASVRGFGTTSSQKLLPGAD